MPETNNQLGLPWLGLAGDISYFRPDAGGADIHVIPISPLVMFATTFLTAAFNPTQGLDRES